MKRQQNKATKYGWGKVVVVLFFKKRPYGIIKRGNFNILRIMTKKLLYIFSVALLVGAVFFVFGGKAQASPPQITTTALPPGIQGQPYPVTKIELGPTGNAPFTFQIINGSLPQSLVLSNPTASNPYIGYIQGVISASETVGQKTFTIKVTDNNNNSSQKDFSITISAPTAASSGPCPAPIPYVPPGGRPLEVTYPVLGNTTAPTGTKTPLGDFMRYAFNFIIGISGLIVFAVIFFSGFKLLTSAQNPAAFGEAKSRIFDAIIGLVLILGSYLILTTINPQLVLINPKTTGIQPATGPYGVCLCENNAKTNCIFYSSSVAKIDDKFEDNVSYIGFNNPTAQKEITNDTDCPSPPDGTITETGGKKICTYITERYGAVLHEGKDYSWTCKSFFDTASFTPKNASRIFPGDGVSSLTLFRHASEQVGRGVYFFEDENFGGAFANFVSEDKTNLQNAGPGTDLDNKVSSLKIDGNFMALLFDGEIDDKNNTGTGTGSCEIFTQSDENLSDNPIGDNTASSVETIWIK